METAVPTLVYIGNDNCNFCHHDAMQNLYGRTIRDNKGDSAKMSQEAWAIVKHYASTIDHPQYENCPKGERSWCSYQRDIATGSQTYKPAKSPFSAAIVNAVTPIFKRLADA